MELYPYQLDAIKRLHDGSVLCGDVGSGKSRTALAYYFSQYGGDAWSKPNNICPMVNPDKLYIITTARKRDTLEWESELVYFFIPPERVVIDSWNNLHKYKDVRGCFFIFDEQRVVGKGAWVKAFLKITRCNHWILLSATPGDKWEDYIPVFIANGFYKNRTEFSREHLVYSTYTKFPKIERYLNTGRLLRLRNKILVNMDFHRKTVAHHEDVYTSFDVSAYKDICRDRWDPWEDRPIVNATEFCLALRRVVNSAESRQLAVLELFEKHPKVIIFYNFDYELYILKELGYGPDVEIAEWNGHKHQPIPESDSWVYLVQYNAGAEGWNCVKTDTIIFYSQNYSYRTMVQASGRIDRLNTPYLELYYYHLKSRSGIDLAISKAMKNKKQFNESRFFEKGEK